MLRDERREESGPGFNLESAESVVRWSGSGAAAGSLGRKARLALTLTFTLTLALALALALALTLTLTLEGAPRRGEVRRAGPALTLP